MTVAFPTSPSGRRTDGGLAFCGEFAVASPLQVLDTPGVDRRHGSQSSARRLRLYGRRTARSWRGARALSSSGVPMVVDRPAGLTEEGENPDWR